MKRAAAAEGEQRATRPSYGRLYLQKIVQLHFDLPRPSPGRVRGLIASLVEGASRAAPPAQPAAGQRPLPSAGDRMQSGLPRRADGATPAAPLAARPGVAATVGVAGLAAATRPRAPARVLLAFPGAAPRDGVASVLGALGSPLLFAVIVAALGGVYEALPEPLSSFLTSGPSMLATATLVGGVQVTSWVRGQRRHEERLQAQRRAIDDALASSPSASVGELAHAAASIGPRSPTSGEPPGADPGIEALIAERRQLQLINDSDYFRRALAEAEANVPPLPRHAKRLVNRLRLMVYVAHERSLGGGAAAIDPRHVGRWAVLQERWPELASWLVDHPRGMSALEGAVGDRERFATLAGDVDPDLAGDADLRDFCAAVPRLGPVMDRLVRFEVETGPAPRGGK